MKLTLCLGNQDRLPPQPGMQWQGDAKPWRSQAHPRCSLALQGCWYVDRPAFLLVVVGTASPCLPASIDNMEQARSLFHSLGGNALGILLDKQQQRLAIRTDILGLCPFYVQQSDDRFYFATETKCFGDEPNAGAWAELLQYGYQFSDHTLVRGINKLPAATITEWDLQSLAQQERCYWQWPAPNLTPDIDVIAETFQADVRQYLSYPDPGQLLLSGGLDSRLILYALRREKLRPHCLIVRHREEALDADGQMARRLAARCRVPVTVVSPTNNYFASGDYLKHIADCDACYPTLSLFISQLSPFIDSQPVWEGAIPNYTISTVMLRHADLDGQLASIVRDPSGRIWQAARALFNPEFIEAMQAHLATLPTWVKTQYSNDEFGAHQMMARSRLRRRTAAVPVSIYQQKAPVFLPGLSSDFLDASASISFEQRRQGGLYRRLYQHAYPDALSVPIISGGKILDIDNAPWLRRRIRWQSQLAAFIGRRPRLRRWLSPRPAAPNPLLSSDFLYNPADPLLRTDFDPARLADPVAAQLLFHWQSWRLLHQAKLQQQAAPLLENAKA